jgi:23S rRNA (cytidine1920-2'-O)/16S rRNA (cytidine1409-2'-O)-methyltransferase
MKDHPYASRGGLKLEHALRAFGLDVTGLRCADFGASTGGFTDCLLRHGAASVVALETGYGVLDYRLRTDPRVTVKERTNVLHEPPPQPPVELVTADLSWTRQQRFLPTALAWIGHRRRGRILSLVKPHYEVEGEEKARLVKGVLSQEAAASVLERVLGELPACGVEVLGSTLSPIRGGGSRSRKNGNREYLVLLAPAEAPGSQVSGR